MLTDYSLHKQSRDEAIANIRQEVLTVLSEEYKGEERAIEAAYGSLVKSIFRQLILDTGVRWGDEHAVTGVV